MDEMSDRLAFKKVKNSAESVIYLKMRNITMKLAVGGRKKIAKKDNAYISPAFRRKQVRNWGTKIGAVALTGIMLTNFIGCKPKEEGRMGEKEKKKVETKAEKKVPTEEELMRRWELTPEEELEKRKLDLKKITPKRLKEYEPPVKELPLIIEKAKPKRKIITTEKEKQKDKR